MNVTSQSLVKKSKLFLISFITLNVSLYAQTHFEKGFFIRNNNEKVECEIKNEDWFKNPTEITYRLEEDTTDKVISIEEIQSFQILNKSKYIKKNVEVNKSENDIYGFNNKRTYRFERETILLEVILEGKLSLYQYTNSNFTNFYIHKRGEETELLVYNEFISDEGKINHDRHYRQQLINHMQGSGIPISSFKKLLYYKKELSNLVKKYNKAMGEEIKDFVGKKINQKPFNFYIRPGISDASLYVIDNAFATTDDVDFGRQLTFRIGVEAEYLLPYRNNKWSLFLEPAFHYYTNEKEIISPLYNKVEVRYKSIELGMGIRHYAFLNKTTKAYINGLFIYDNDINATLTYGGQRIHKITSYYNAALGIGFTYKNTLSLEMRYYTKRDLLKSYRNFRTEYQTITLVAGIRL